MSETAIQVPAILEKPQSERRLPPVSPNLLITSTTLRLLNFLEEIKKQDVAELSAKGIAWQRAKKFGASVLAGLAVSKLGVPVDLVASVSSKH